MPLKLHTAQFEPGGGHQGFHNVVWMTLTMSYSGHGPELGHPQVGVAIPLAKDRACTIGAYEQQFAEIAKQVLRETLHLLDAHSIEELEEIGEMAQRAWEMEPLYTRLED